MQGALALASLPDQLTPTQLDPDKYWRGMRVPQSVGFLRAHAEAAGEEERAGGDGGGGGGGGGAAEAAAAGELAEVAVRLEPVRWEGKSADEVAFSALEGSARQCMVVE